MNGLRSLDEGFLAVESPGRFWDESAGIKYQSSWRSIENEDLDLVVLKEEDLRVVDTETPVGVGLEGRIDSGIKSGIWLSGSMMVDGESG